MILRIVTLLILSVPAVIATLWFADNPGQVMVDWLGWRIETNVPVLLILLTALLITLVVAERALAALTQLPLRLHKDRQTKTQQTALTLLLKTLDAATSGNTQTARQMAAQTAKKLNNPDLAKQLDALIPKSDEALPLAQMSEVVRPSPGISISLSQSETASPAMVRPAAAPRPPVARAVPAAKGPSFLSRLLAPRNRLTLPADRLVQERLSQMKRPQPQSRAQPQPQVSPPPVSARSSLVHSAELDELADTIVPQAVLVAQAQDHLTKGRQAFEAQQWTQARLHLVAAIKGDPTVDACLMMARIEEIEDNPTAVEMWHKRAKALAPPEESAAQETTILPVVVPSGWQCQACDAVVADWSLVCPCCAQTSTVLWQPQAL